MSGAQTLRGPTRRAKDRGRPLAAFAGEALVVNPRCQGPAFSKPRDAAGDIFAPRRLVCRRCGHVQEWNGRTVALGAPAGRDPHFGLPLWLATPCCGDVLWAYNARHLEALADFVHARLRERARDPDNGWSNAATTSRLPRWIKAAKHRAEVEKGIARLRARLEKAS